MSESLRWENIKLQQQIHDMLRLLKTAIHLEEEEERELAKSEMVGKQNEREEMEAEELIRQNNKLKAKLEKALTTDPTSPTTTTT